MKSIDLIKVINGSVLVNFNIDLLIIVIILLNIWHIDRDRNNIKLTGCTGNIDKGMVVGA